MRYPRIPDYRSLSDSLALHAALKAEYGARGIQPILADAERALRAALSRLEALPVDPALRSREPDSLPAIRRLRPRGPRALWKAFDADRYLDKLGGALLARMAGCTLGAIVEGWTVDRMKEWAKTIGDPFPPVDYWSRAWTPHEKRYQASECRAYTRTGMNGVPVDDDIAYTLLGLLIVEDHGLDFTTDDVGRSWLKYLPYACTAEDVALKNLKRGVPARKAAESRNPFVQWIGADIRSDPWAYLAPGLPERAAEMAHRDAYLSHRRNGIYGEMFFAAAQAAAFAVDDPREALRIGLTEIPRGCALARDVRWALAAGRGIHGYADARAAVDERFGGMHAVHTNNNACLTVFGLMIGGTDVTRVISEVVAMGLDNDCTAATAGSIVGAIVGRKGVPAHWHRRFRDTVHSYLIGRPTFRISGLLDRFSRQARKQFSGPASRLRRS
jgi:ADP-ribosylglycohydrolase